MFRRPQNNVTCFLIINTFIYIYINRQRYDLKQYQSQALKGVKRKINIVNERLAE